MRIALLIYVIAPNVLQNDRLRMHGFDGKHPVWALFEKKGGEGNEKARKTTHGDGRSRCRPCLSVVAISPRVARSCYSFDTESF